MMGVPSEPGRIHGFARLIGGIYRARRNVLVVKTTPRSPDTGMREVEVGTPQIHLWIEGQDNNANLMLIFAYLLRTSPEWAGARLTIKALLPNEEARASTGETLRAFLEEARLEADISPEVKERETPLIDEIARISHDADLVFLELRGPEEKESERHYARYLEETLASAHKLHNAVLTLAGQGIEFHEVFR